MVGSSQQNNVPNMYENEFFRDEVDVEAASGEDIDDQNQRPKKKRYRRHTKEQIQELEAFFKQLPHPNERERNELGVRLGLDPLQVKFWFQNKRTQLKTLAERGENEFLKAEIVRLQGELNRYQEAIGKITTCNVCGNPATDEMSCEEQQLRLENALLKKEIERLGQETTTNNIGGDSHTNISSSHNSNQAASHSVDVNGIAMVGEAYAGGAGGGNIPAAPPPPPLLQSLDDERRIVELAVIGMDELIRLAKATGPPLWLSNHYHHTETLNQAEYLKHFPRPNPLGLKAEGSKESVIVIMNHINLVDSLMDVNRWSNMFCGIVSNAATLKVMSTGVAGNHNGALQVMSAEFQVPTPIFPTRENYFARYCKLHSDGIWAVVDVSLGNLSHSTRTQRRPSGCLIQELPNGYSQITWIEHVEVEDNLVQNIYTPLVNSGLAFGAKRWVATLLRQCERFVCSISNIPATGDRGVIMSAEGRRSMLKLAESMVTSFSTSIGASSAHAWTRLPSNGSEDVRVMTKKYTHESSSGRRNGVLLSVATSFWLPVPQSILFDFLRNENSRSQWDILSGGNIVQEIAHIANGRDPGNCVSLIRINSVNRRQQRNNMVVLQESCTAIAGSYIVYAPVDIDLINAVLSGGDSHSIPLLPSGFAILPDGSIPNFGPAGGSLLTVAFQILVDSVPDVRLSLSSVTTVNALVKATVEKIKVAVMPNVN